MENLGSALEFQSYFSWKSKKKRHIFNNWSNKFQGFNPILVGSQKRSFMSLFITISFLGVSILFQLEVKKEELGESTFRTFRYCFNPILVGSQKRRNQKRVGDFFIIMFQSYFSWKSKKKPNFLHQLVLQCSVSILFQLEVKKEGNTVLKLLNVKVSFQSYFSRKSKKTDMLQKQVSSTLMSFNPILVGSQKRSRWCLCYDGDCQRFQSYFSWKSEKKQSLRPP